MEKMMMLINKTKYALILFSLTSILTSGVVYADLIVPSTYEENRSAKIFFTVMLIVLTPILVIISAIIIKQIRKITDTVMINHYINKSRKDIKRNDTHPSA